MKFKIAIVSKLPIDIKHWPFDDIKISVTDKTYIVIQGEQADYVEILNDLYKILPHGIEGLAVTFEKPTIDWRNHENIH